MIKDTFGSNGLKQYIEFIDANVIFSTIHGAKGLEWDYVILPDMEAFLLFQTTMDYVELVVRVNKDVTWKLHQIFKQNFWKN